MDVFHCVCDDEFIFRLDLLVGHELPIIAVMPKHWNRSVPIRSCTNVALSGSRLMTLVFQAELMTAIPKVRVVVNSVPVLTLGKWPSSGKNQNIRTRQVC